MDLNGATFFWNGVSFHSLKGTLCTFSKVTFLSTKHFHTHICKASFLCLKFCFFPSDFTSLFSFLSLYLGNWLNSCGRECDSMYHFVISIIIRRKSDRSIRSSSPHIHIRHESMWIQDICTQFSGRTTVKFLYWMNPIMCENWQDLFTGFDTSIK